jgi:hypothetical protein
VDPQVLSLFGNETCLHGRNDHIGNVTAVRDANFPDGQAITADQRSWLFGRKLQLCGHSAKFIAGQQ